MLLLCAYNVALPKGCVKIGIEATAVSFDWLVKRHFSFFIPYSIPFFCRFDCQVLFVFLFFIASCSSPILKSKFWDDHQLADDHSRGFQTHFSAVC
jgi:hypothetical protein